MSYRVELINRINKLLSREISVPEFQDMYYFYYINEAGGSLSVDDNIFFGDIQEKLDYVDDNPSEDDRKYGYINYEEYIEWLREKMKSLPNGNNQPPSEKS